jgi:hypothetical protein
MAELLLRCSAPALLKAGTRIRGFRRATVGAFVRLHWRAEGDMDAADTNGTLADPIIGLAAPV